MLPVLVLVADVIGVMGGFVVSVWKLGFQPIEYINRTFDYLEPQDVISGLVKAAVFGFIVALMGCYQGYHSKGGAQGVGVGHDARRGLGLDPDPGRQLHGDRAVLQPMSDAAAPKIRIRGLEKSFGPKQVLRGVDLDVPVGSSLVVIGGSGTGKSVLIKCVLGILEPDAGSIQVDGEELVGADGATRERARAKFGMLFQGGALFDSLPVWENVAFGMIAKSGIAATRRAGARDRDPGQGRARSRGRRSVARPSCRAGCRSVSGWPGPSARRRRSSSSTSRPPGSTRSWPTSSTA